ncbi:MAG: OmpH family outer membrane protein [Phycisphaerales bacterium]
MRRHQNHNAQTTPSPESARRAANTAPARWLATAIIAGAAAGSAVGLLALTQPAATAQARPDNPTPVAIVDLNKILAQLEEQRDQAAILETLEAEQNDLIKKLESEVETLKGEIEVLPAGQERRQILEQLARTQVREQTERRFAQLLLEDRARGMLTDLFGKIQTAITEYAKREGYEIVLSSDAAIRFPTGLNLQQTDLFISNRRVLFAADAVDISDSIATLMNNNYRLRNDAP